MADSDSPSSLWSGVARWGRAVLIRLSVVVVVFLVGAGGVWLIARAAIPFASPTTTDIPALRIEPADVEPGSTAPVKPPTPVSAH